MIGVRYTGTFTDYSGYGSANRAFIAALYTAGVDVTTELVVQVREHSKNGWTQDLAMNLVDRDIPYKIKITHLTPDLYPKYIEKKKYNIGHLFWETDRLPAEWIDPINKMQELWVSSEGMANLFRSCGVHIPMYWFGQPVDVSEGDKLYSKFNLPGHKGFLFYSVFQWIERKNPRGLLEAYWETFTGRNDVSLLLKTYRSSYDPEEYEKIQLDIARWKREKRLVHYPRVYLTTKLLTHEDVMRVHATGDCYVTADHGEGWCRPLQESFLMGKPAISTARGGIHEYVNQDMYYPIKSTYVPAVQQSWIPWYTPDQNWATPNKEELKEQMQFVFANKELALVKAMKAKNFMKEQFSYTAIGNQMRTRLEKIYKGL
jgi:glycosyltransferase involved in cell wall biosynthesis